MKSSFCLVGTIAVFGVALLRAQPSVPRAVAPELDAIVVGAGISGLCAALEMAGGGANVTIVDMASVFGGHAVMATGDLCLIGTPLQEARGFRDTPEIAFNDFVTWGEDPNREWVRYYVNNSRREIYDWVSAMGVTFDSFVTPAGNSVTRTHRTRGRGLALVSPIYAECLHQTNIAFRWNTRLDRLIRAGGRVVGIAATDLRTGQPLELRAKLIVLATGGFQSNLDLVRQTWPAGLPFPENVLIGSGINSLGSGLKIARDIGAAITRLDHQWNYTTGLPDPRLPASSRRGLNAFSREAINVNAEGRRFVAERSGYKYELPVMLQQSGATYWAIFDEAIKPAFFVAGSDWSNFHVVERQIFQNPALVQSAATIEALASKAGLPPAALAETVRNFNEQVAKGVDTEFGRFGPGKSWQPKKIATPPFYAVKFVPLTRKSMGGVVIDTSCRVQDAEQKTIPGLYAVGELTGLAGINGKAGLEGTFLGPSIITGRVAGRAALAELGRQAATTRVAPRPPPTPPKPDPLANTALCMACHDLPKLVAQPREGYWHFESVHRAVLAKKLDCTKCHAELTPTFQPAAHRIDRFQQIQTCATCHQGEDK